MPLDTDRSPAAIRTHWILSCLAVFQSALALWAIPLSLRYDLPEWFDRAWMGFVIMWLFWPFALVLHRGRSVWRVALPLFISALLLAPCLPRFVVLAPRVFSGTDRMPTIDRPNLVESENLGGGFRRVALEEFITGGFESVYHGEYLYYGKRRVSYFVSSSLSPSRTFAAYADSDPESEQLENQPGFHVFLFRAADQQILRVTTNPVDYVGEFKWEWDEAAGQLVLHFKDGRPPEKFMLPPKA